MQRTKTMYPICAVILVFISAVDATVVEYQVVRGLSLGQGVWALDINYDGVGSLLGCVIVCSRNHDCHAVLRRENGCDFLHKDGIILAASESPQKPMVFMDPLAAITVEGKDGKYSLTFEEAEKVCMELDGRIATKQELEAAFKLGYSVCRCGWIADQSILVPNGRSDCMVGYHIGIVSCDTMFLTKADAYCYLN